MNLTIQNIVENPEQIKLKIPSFNAKSGLEKTAQRMIDKYGFVDLKEPPNLEEIYERVFSILNDINAETDISIKDLKAVSVYLFKSDTNADFITKYIAYITKINNPRVWSSLIIHYIMQYNEEREIFKKISSLILKNSKNLSKVWKKSTDYINCFDINKSTKLISKEILKLQNHNQVLSKLNLRGPFLSGGFVREVYFECANMINKEFKKENFNNYSFFLNIISVTNKLNEAFGSVAMYCFLEPLNEITLSNNKKMELQNLFIGTYGDPRIRPQNWPQIPQKYGGFETREACISIVKKWLTSQSIKLFFDIIEEHAIDHQFAPRRELWEKCFENDMITEAHAILGNNASMTARRVKKENEEARTLDWGTLTGASSDQSVLLMKLSNGAVLTVWSHSGKFRAWFEQNDDKPEFYRREYSGKRLRLNSDYDKVQGGNWVPVIRTFLRNQTGVRV